MGKNKLKGITRVDNEKRGPHGWYCRIYYQSKVYDNKYFGDKKYSGKDNALKAALQYRAATTLRLYKEHPDAKIGRSRVSSSARNKTGIIGISRIRIVGKTGKVNEYFHVTWRPKKNRVKVKMFSINKYGEAGALARAWEVRKQAEIKLYGKAQIPNFDIYKKNYPDKQGEPDGPEFKSGFKWPDFNAGEGFP